MAMIDKLARLTKGPLFVRGVTFMAAWAAMWLAAPAPVATPRYALLMALAALAPAIGPNTRLVTGVMLLIIAGWAASVLGAGEEATGLRTFGVAVGLYLLHSAAALAAVLPYDSIVDRVVLLRWAARCVMVILAGAVVAAIIVWLAPSLTPGSSVPALLAGLAAVAALLALLTYASRPRRRRV
jgi:hypothetical protein